MEWWRPAGRSDTSRLYLYCPPVRYRLINDRSDPEVLAAHSLCLPPTPPRAGGRTRSGSAKTGEEVTSVSLGWWLCLVFAGANNAGCRRRQSFSTQNSRYPQICSFTACGGGVSGVSLVGNVGVCEAASQCGDGKGSVLPMRVLLCLLACLRLLVKKPGNPLCACVRARRSETHGKSWSVSHSSSSAVVMHGADIVVCFDL